MIGVQVSPERFETFATFETYNRIRSNGLFHRYSCFWCCRLGLFGLHTEACEGAVNRLNKLR